MEPFPAAVAAQPNQRPNYGSFRARGWTRSLQFGASKCVCRLRRLGGAGRGTRTRHERGDEIWGRRTDRRRTTVVLVCCTSERLSPPEKTAMAAGGDQEPMWNLNEICTVRYAYVYVLAEFLLFFYYLLNWGTSLQATSRCSK